MFSGEKNTYKNFFLRFISLLFVCAAISILAPVNIVIAQDIEKLNSSADSLWFVKKMIINGPEENIIYGDKFHLNEPYIVNNNKVKFLNGVIIENLPLELIGGIQLLATDGKYVIFFTWENKGESFTSNIYVCKFKNISKGMITNLQKCDLSFSHSVYSVTFFDKGKVLITGIMEYAVLEMKPGESYDDSIKMNIEHNFMDDPFAFNGVHEGSSMINDTKILYNNYLVYSFNYNGSSYDFSKVMSIDNIFPGINKLDEYNYITYCTLLDSNTFVITLTDKICIAQKSIDNSFNYHFLHSPQLTEGKVFTIDNNCRLIAISKNELWAIKENGIIVSIRKKKNSWDELICSELPQIPDKLNNIRMDLNHTATPVIISDNKFYVFERTYKKDEVYQPTYSFIFNEVSLQEPGNTYGVAVLDLQGNAEESILAIDISYNNNVYYKNFADTYQLNPSVKLGLSGRKVKDEKPITISELDLGVTSGDIDEDGDEDVLISYLDGSNQLLLNNGDGYFRNVTEEFNIDIPMWRSECVTLADVNNDGFLDLFMTSFLNTNRLFINDKGKGFIDYTDKSGLRSEGTSITACFCDINMDDYEDIYLANWVKPNKLYINNGDGTFYDATNIAGVSCGIGKKTNSIVLADFDNDGDPDLFVGNRGNGNYLFRNNGKSIFEDVTQSSGITNYGITYGAAAGDFDNDGFLDLWVNQTDGVIVYKNESKNDKIKFTEVTKQVLNNLKTFDGYNTGVVTFDNDKDGDLDLYIGQFDGRDYYVENSLNKELISNKNFIDVKVHGSKTNSSAIGVKLRLFMNDELIAYREISSNYGYASSGSKIQHFGISDPETRYKLEIEFPVTGEKRLIDISPGMYKEIYEETGFAKFETSTIKSVFRILYGKDSKMIFSKVIFLLCLLLALKWFSKHKRFAVNYFNRNVSFTVILVTLVFFVIFSYLMEYSQQKFIGTDIWVSGSHNLIVEDILPFVLAFIFFAGIQYPRYAKQLEPELLLPDLFLQLRKFSHGEGMANNLTRIKFFLLNIDKLFSGDTGLIHQFNSAIKEYLEITGPEINEIHKNIFNVKTFPKRKIIRELADNLYKSNENLTKLIRSLIHFNIDSESANNYGNEYKLISVEIETIKTNINQILDLLSSVYSTDINKIMESLLEKFNSDKNSDVTFDFVEPDVRSVVLIKHAELYESISLIIQNAIDALSDYNGNFKQIVVRVEKWNEFKKILISDNGSGISNENREHIFESGFTTKNHGTGFGLSYVWNTVTRYGGKIKFNSEENKGTTFELYLFNLS